MGISVPLHVIGIVKV